MISISQCKLIEWDNLENQTTPITYNAAFPAATWLKEADLTVYREYLDTSSQATITFMPTCTCWCGTACSGDSYTGCVWVIDEQISKVRIPLSTYSSGSWSCNYPNICGCYHGSKVEVSYRAGTTDVPGWQNAVMRLAHTYMPITTCGCNLYRELVKRDTRIPPVLTAERLNCPLGEKDGAWYAWNWTETNQHGKAFMLGSVRLSTRKKLCYA
ncbi:MAG: hypothetical protein GTO22_03820 [Gemmatimonadales bacterium]|nr:hypothetical protein [Gemmatimonadales bacterium]